MNERFLIILLCLAAALRVFIYSAAFPFFSNIDEDLHFDLVTQYSHVEVPRRFDRLKDDTLNWIIPYGSPEFLSCPEQFPGATCPTKISNVSPVAVAVTIIIARLVVIIRRAPRAGLIALAAIVLCASNTIGS